MGILVATCAVIASNTYIIMNTYRWDWLTVLINVISSLLIFFWTGVYSSVIASAQFYKSAAQTYGALSFWVVLLVTVMICLLPRFTVKSIQKVFFPLDVDIIREQVTQGKFKYLDERETFVPKAGGSATDSAASSDLGKPINAGTKQNPFSDDQQIYAESVAPTVRTHNQRGQNGSNGTTYASSLDTTQYPHPQAVDYVRSSAERTRHSFDRARDSYDRARQSFDAAEGFPSANNLTRVESSLTTGAQRPQSPHSPLSSLHDPPSYRS
jgi:phospholipid-translocating ATPase